ncbi:MAG: CopG family transcriptional regulator [Nevskiales bacterium]
MKTIQMTIDELLLKAVDRLSRLRKTTRSALIRNTLAAELRREKIRHQEALHREGYRKHPVKAGEFDI